MAPAAVAASVLGALGLPPLSLLGILLGKWLGRAVEKGKAPERARRWARAATLLGTGGFLLTLYRAYVMVAAER